MNVIVRLKCKNINKTLNVSISCIRVNLASYVWHREASETIRFVLRNFMFFVFLFGIFFLFFKHCCLNRSPDLYGFISISLKSTNFHFKRHLATCLHTSAVSSRDNIYDASAVVSLWGVLASGGCRLNTKLWFRSKFRPQYIKTMRDLKFIWNIMGPNSW